MKGQTYKLVRNCEATLIPAGDVVTIEEGSEVTISQALGGSVTVTAPNGLFRINAENWDALGEDAVEALRNEFASDDASNSLEGPYSDEQVWSVLKTCFDPEIPVNIVDLGLIYDLQATDATSGKAVEVKMTLTAQGCGMGPTIAADAQQKIESLASVERANVEVVWDPPWNPKMISEEGKKKLGIE